MTDGVKGVCGALGGEICYCRMKQRYVGAAVAEFLKLLACGARGPGFDSRPRHLNFQRLVISSFKSRYG